MLDMGLHLRVCIGHCVGNVYLIAWIHEGVVEAHGPVGSLLLWIQVVDLLLVR